MTDPEKLAATWRIMAESNTIEEVLDGLKPLLLRGERPPRVCRRSGPQLSFVNVVDDGSDQLAAHNAHRLHCSPAIYEGHV